MLFPVSDEVLNTMIDRVHGLVDAGRDDYATMALRDYCNKQGWPVVDRLTELLIKQTVGVCSELGPHEFAWVLPPTWTVQLARDSHLYALSVHLDRPWPLRQTLLHAWQRDQGWIDSVLDVFRYRDDVIRIRGGEVNRGRGKA